MTASVPASQIVSVTPSVLSAGGRALDLIGLALTTSPLVPIGTVPAFATPADVQGFFGADSDEAQAAAVYFLGYDNSFKKPGALLFAQYPVAAVSAYLRSATILLNLGQLQTLSGDLGVLVDGVPKSALAISLAGVTSFSAAADAIASATGVACAWDAGTATFTLASSTTGSGSTMGEAIGSLADELGFSTLLGGVTSQGADAADPSTFMDSITAVTRNWASFTTLFEANLGDKLNFAAWNTGTNGQSLYAEWDTDATDAQYGAVACFGQLNGPAGANNSGTVPIYQSRDHAMFLMGAIASIDFGRRNGRTTLAFRSQAGLTASVTNASVATALIANGYNFYGAYATANDRFTFLTGGSISGQFAWIDTYINEIWMTNNFQLALMILLTQVGSVPFDEAGYALIRAAGQDPINQAINFGAIRSGVSLSAAQAAEVNQQAGVRIDDLLSTRGWYLQVLDPTPQVRAARGSPQCTFWYTDGGSVQSINLASITIQ